MKDAGLSPCCGALFGMGESDDDIVEVAQALRAIGVDSIPVNFLIPIQGTPLADRWSLTPTRCLKILSLMRLTNPQTANCASPAAASITCGRCSRWACSSRTRSSSATT